MAVDYSFPVQNFGAQIAGIGDAYHQGQERARQGALRDAFKGGLPKDAEGNIDFAKTADIVARLGGDMGTLLQLGALGEEQMTGQRVRGAFGQPVPSMGQPSAPPVATPPAGLPRAPQASLSPEEVITPGQAARANAPPPLTPLPPQPLDGPLPPGSIRFGDQTDSFADRFAGEPPPPSDPISAAALQPPQALAQAVPPGRVGPAPPPPPRPPATPQPGDAGGGLPPAIEAEVSRMQQILLLPRIKPAQIEAVKLRLQQLMPNFKLETIETPEGKVTGLFNSRTGQFMRMDVPGGRPKLETGFQQSPTGQGHTFIPGGPADPAYLRLRTEATERPEKPRQLSVGDVTKLQEEAGKFSSLTRFAANFKDEFAGFVPGVGNVATWVGRHAPAGWAPDRWEKAATFWQDYDRFKNVVRNELFGATLTPGETRAFEAADIKPDMNPEQIKLNLATQRAIAERGLKVKANALLAEGFRPESIAAAYGIPLSDIGVTPQQRGGGGGGSGQTRPRLVPNETVVDNHLYLGGDPNNPNSWKRR